MDDPVTITLESTARTAPLAITSAAEFARPVSLGVGSIEGAGHHRSSA